MLVDLWFRTAQELWDNLCRASYRALPKDYQTAIMDHYAKNTCIMAFQPHLPNFPNIPGC